MIPTKTCALESPWSANGLESLIGKQYSSNVWSQRILEVLEHGAGEPWLKYGWRQYMAWFGAAENELSSLGLPEVNEWLKSADQNWLLLDDKGVLMDDRRNDGQWVRCWRQAIQLFGRGG